MLVILALATATLASNSVAPPSPAAATGVFPSTAKDRGVIVDGDSGDITIREWLSAATGSHSGGDFSSSSDATFSLSVPTTVTELDIIAFGGGGGGAGGTASNTGWGTGGGGGGGGEVRRLDNLSVTPTETLSVQVGRAGARGSADQNAGNGGDSFLKRGTTALLLAQGGEGGTRARDGRAGGAGGTSGSGGTLLTNGVRGVDGSANASSPADLGALDNSSSDWVIAGLRVAAGGGGGGGRSSVGGSGGDFSEGTAVNTASTGFTASGNRIGGEGEGGNDAYPQFANKSIHAFEFSGSGGGGGGAVFSNSGNGGGHGGSGGVIFAYVLANLGDSQITPASASIRLNASTQLTLQLRDGSTNANVSAGDVTFSVSGLSGASLSGYTDNGDGSYTVILNSGSTTGTAVVGATIGGESFADTASVVVNRLTQTVSWNPPSEQTSVVLADSGLVINSAATSGDGAITYSVTNSGSTACAIDGSRNVTFQGTGTCVITATAAQTDSYNQATTTHTLTVARGTFSISSPSSKVGVTSSSFTDVCTSTCDITGFAPADQVLVVVSKSDGTALSGRVRLDSASFTGGLTLGDLNGVTGYNGGNSSNLNNASGYAEIAFVGTQVEINRALEALQYEGPSGGGDETIGISASLSGAALFDGHYYLAVETQESWTDARDAAEARSFNGLTGYLATITSAEENTFVADKVSQNAWLGGSDNYQAINQATGTTTYANQTAAEGKWYWVTGPEAGTQFWEGAASGARVGDQFNSWSSGNEPNDHPNAGTVGEEDYLHGRFGIDEDWNDFPEDPSGGLYYIVEFGGMPGESALKEAATTFTVGAPTAPLQVAGASAAAGNTQVVLSWSAPDSGGSAITDYVVEQFDADTSTWNILTDGVSTATSFTVTGLTNGTSYSFRVSAKNAIGTGTVSATVTATPVTPPAPAPSSGGGSGGGTTPPTPTTTPTSPAIPRILTPPQPIPRPSVLQGPVTSPGRGFDPNAGTRATIGGSPATVTQQTLPGGGLSVTTGAFQMGVALSNPSSGGGVDTNNPSNRPELRVPQGQSTTVNGGGLLPGSQLQVWLPGRPGSTP